MEKTFNWLLVPGRISAPRRWELIILAHVRRAWMRHYTAASSFVLIEVSIFCINKFTYFHPNFGSRCRGCRHSVFLLFVLEIYAISHWTLGAAASWSFFFCWPPPNACCTAVWQQEERPKKPVANLINKRVLFALTFISLSLYVYLGCRCVRPPCPVPKRRLMNAERDHQIFTLILHLITVTGACIRRYNARERKRETEARHEDKQTPETTLYTWRCIVD